MSRYHIGVNGPAVCRATKGNCPLDNSSELVPHFDELADAEAYYDVYMTERYGQMSKELAKPVGFKIPTEAKKSGLFELPKRPQSEEEAYEFLESNGVTVEQRVDTDGMFYADYYGVIKDDVGYLGVRNDYSSHREIKIKSETKEIQVDIKDLSNTVYNFYEGVKNNKPEDTARGEANSWWIRELRKRRDKAEEEKRKNQTPSDRFNERFVK